VEFIAAALPDIVPARIRIERIVVSANTLRRRARSGARHGDANRRRP